MTSDNDFATTFFEELGAGGGEFALCLLRDRVFENGIHQPPSPRAQPFFNSGEWDIERTMLHLIPVSGDDACFGVFPPLCFVARGAHYTRFCGLTRCATQSHLKQKLDQDLRQSGWYMEAGSGAIKGVDMFQPQVEHPSTGL